MSRVNKALKKKLFFSVEYLYVARLLVGVSTAIITTTVYTIEVASKDMRGTFSLIESVLRFFLLRFFFYGLCSIQLKRDTLGGSGGQ